METVNMYRKSPPVRDDEDEENPNRGARRKLDDYFDLPTNYEIDKMNQNEETDDIASVLGYAYRPTSYWVR